jgi:HPt (histidine-containing phosphotransfer) domain-containing protein
MIRQVKSATQLPIVALSASCDKADRLRCLEAGMNDFVRSPVSATLLVSTVQKWCSAGASRQLSSTVGSTSATGLRAAAAIPTTLEATRALGRLGGNMSLYRKLLDRFEKSVPVQRELLQTAFTEHDYVGATALVHNLVSAAGNIGATRLHQVAQSLEVALRSDDGALVQKQRAYFESELEDAFDAVKRILSQPDTLSRPPLSARTNDVQLRLLSLRRLIGEHDTAAVEVVDSLEDAFVDDPHNYDALRRLAQSVMGYDFESAARQLDTLCLKLNYEPLGVPR